MLARFLRARGQPKHFVLIKAFFVEVLGRDHGDHLRLAFRERAGLVDDERVDLFHALEGFGVLDQDSGLGTTPYPNHDRHRRREAERTWACDDQDGHRRHQPECEPRLRPVDAPGRERYERNRDHRRHEPARHLVGEPLDRRPRALGGRDHLHDAGEHGVAADLFRPHDEAACRIERAGDDFRSHVLRHRHGFARDHRLVDRRAAFDQLAVDRNLLARSNPEPIADGDHVQGYLFVAPIRFQTPRRLRCEIEQGTDGARRLLTRPQLQHLTEQHEHGDDRRCLEIDRDCAVGAAKRRREQAGRQNPDHAVEPRHAGTHGDQREHVQIAREKRLPAAHEERPAAPEHDRRGEHELQPVRPRADKHMQIEQVAAHLEHDDGQREHESDPEPPRHVGKLGVRRRFGGDQLGLECHAADRARAGADLPDLRMHRAGIDGAFRHRWRRLCLRRREIFRRVGCEFPAASGGAEVIRPPAVLSAMRRLVRVDRHAADRIAHALPGGFGAMRRLVRAVSMVGVVVGHCRSWAGLKRIPCRGI